MRCSIKNCYFRGSGRRLFGLPSDEGRRNLWLEKIDDPSLVEKPHIKICDLHFEERFKKPQPFPGATTRLLPDAVPTLDLHLDFVVKAATRKSPPATYVVRLPPPDSSESSTVRFQSLPGPSKSLPIYNQVPSSEKATQSLNYVEGPTKCLPVRRYRQIKLIKGSSRVPVQLQRNILFQRSSCRNKGSMAKSRVQELEQNIAKQKVAVKSLKRKNMLKYIAQYRKTNDIGILMDMIGDLSRATKKFLKSQIRYQNAKPRPRRFTVDEKLLSIALYKQCPQGYKYLRKTFVLPTIETVKRELNMINLEPGINNLMFKHLKVASERELVSSFSKYCILMFDVMAVKPSLSYNYASDTIYGFEDFGWGKKAILADNVLVFMLRGLADSWKQPVAYIFCASPIQTSILVQFIKQVISEVFRAGLHVVATVSDQGISNVEAIKILQNESRTNFLRDGKQFKSVGYFIENTEILHIYDPPHLMKCMRNQLLLKNLKFRMDGKTYVASWQDIIKFYEYDCKRYENRRCVKLTDSHILPKKIPKMKIQHCIQVFSRTVAVSIANLLREADPSLHNLSQRAAGTAKLCRFLDELFDSVNGFGIASPLKPLFSALTERTSHIQFWNEAEEILLSMKFISGSGQISVPSFITKWIETISAIKALWQNLRNSGFVSLTTRLLNQDPLQNLFGHIRSQGSFTSNPTCANFRSSFNSLLMDNVMTPHSIRFNCETDSDELLITLDMFIDERNISSQPSPNWSIDLVPPTDKDNAVDFLEHSYATGYVARRILRISNSEHCKQCRRILTNFPDREPRLEQLIRSEDITINLYRQTTNILLRLLPYVCHLTGIRNGFNVLIRNNVDVFLVNCGIHDLSAAFVIFCSKFLIYYWCRTVNQILCGRGVSFPQQMDHIQRAALDLYEKQQKSKQKKNK